MAQGADAEISSARQWLARWYPRAIVVVAAVYFAELYASRLPSYLDLSAYAEGRERMPFQARELMRYPLLWADRSATLQHLTHGRAVVNSPAQFAVEIIACISLLLAGWVAAKIYRAVSPRARAPWLPFAILIVICLFDFVLTVPYTFPYDLPALMFLGWGLYFVVREQFAWLLLTVAVGTWNRETMLFVVLVFGLSRLMRSGRLRLGSVTKKDVARFLALLAVWAAIVALLHHRYAGNPTEAGARIMGNLHALMRPLLWPNILSASAFLLPYLWLKRERVDSTVLRAAILLLPFWVLGLLSVGQILEVRIYGDISVFVAVCAALILRGGFRRERTRELTDAC
jgi:hypothetical protein